MSNIHVGLIRAYIKADKAKLADTLDFHSSISACSITKVTHQPLVLLNFRENEMSKNNKINSNLQKDKVLGTFIINKIFSKLSFVFFTKF